MLSVFRYSKEGFQKLARFDYMLKHMLVFMHLNQKLYHKYVSKVFLITHVVMFKKPNVLIYLVNCKKSWIGEFKIK